MTYAELLKQNGATEEEIKILDSPAARKAFDKLQADTAAAAAEAAASKQAMADFKAETDTWYNGTILPNYTKMEQKAAAAAANEARAVALIRASQDEGLRKVAEDMGYKADAVAPPAANLPAGFDPAKFVTSDSLAGIMERAGEGLAALEDMVLEHRELFPNQPRLNVRELRREAVAAKKTAYEYWEQKYKVPDARAAQSAATQKAHDDAIRKEATDAATAAMASKYGSPDLRPMEPSGNFLVPRADKNRDKQPWEAGDRSNDRVQYATTKVMQQIAGKTN